MQMPARFLDDVWVVYKETLKDPRYYFSVQELLLFARLAKVNLIVTSHRQNEFCVAGSTVASEDQSSVVYVCLGGESVGRVRGHFER